MLEAKQKLSMTSSSTEVLLLWIERRVPREALSLKARETYRDLLNTHTKFKPDLAMDKEQLLEILTELQRREQKAPPERPWRARPVSRVNEVNQARQRVLEALRVNPHNKTKKAIAADAHCHPQTVTKVLESLACSSFPRPLYSYNNFHTPQTLARLDQSISDPDNLMISVSDHKRRTPICSKKFIARRMREVHGLRYLKLKRERRDPTKDKYSPSRADRSLVRSVVLTSMQAFARGNETLLYLDECEFSLCHTPDYCWAKADELPVYNRRGVEESLHVIGLCSQERYLAIQVLDGHPNKNDIYYFITNFLANWTSSGRLVILLDNAGWHVANTVLKSGFKELLLYNVPRMYQLNLIELTFSKAKAEWRKRPIAENKGEEVEELVRIFSEAIPKKGFNGYRRQYLRQVRTITEDMLS
jgi:hypothetical protein